jgi:hypothetical protein
MMRLKTQSQSSGKVGFWKPKGDILSVQKDEEKKVAPPDPLFGGGGCCDGKVAKQIFWYVPMGDVNFGIHMNAGEFERRYKGTVERKELFLNGIAHEYFHHIVDTWCVINEIDRSNLLKRYTKMEIAENSSPPENFRLEEAMANTMAYKWTNSRNGLDGGGSYGLWEAFTENGPWLEGSLTVALQYIRGQYRIGGLTREDGFTASNLEGFKVDEKWRNKVLSSNVFPLEGDELGFKTDPEAGVWHFEVIPFHILKKTNITTDYKAWKTELSDSLDEEE